MLFTGLLCLLGFGIVSAVLCGEGANRLESVDLSPNAKAAGQIAMIITLSTNVDKGSCDEYLMSVDTCWSGLRMVTTGGVFRILLLPLGIIIGTGYWMRFKKERVVTFHGIAHRGRSVARSN
ncbi:hypothetical protein CGGC5_v012886 [Colletotrichum fructicola Nara gc5]|uniref:Uncharacterized protein n=1 Tax=Colletotrichum fructicola (strain Nara gc5) TaxID=1213859 RepID=A0A7J6IT73_COLFN|nr:hypothetical protein CGGC5_v012886 [Colletotrichum fructicola Nara gc5]